MKKSIEKARLKFINGSTRDDCFEIHDGKYYYMDTHGTICLALPISEGIPVNDCGRDFLGNAMRTAVNTCREPLTLPTLAEVKKYRKLKAAWNKENHIAIPASAISYEWDKGIAMKADYLIMAMEMIPDLVLMAYRANHAIYGYSTSCNAEIVICPLKIDKKLWKATNVHCLDEWWECKQAMKTAAAPEAVKPEAPEAVKPAEIVPAAAPAETTPAPRKATRRAAPDFVGKSMIAYPRKPKAPEAPKNKPKSKRRNPAEFVGKKMIITIGERAARPAAD